MRLRAAAIALRLRFVKSDSGYFGHLHDLLSEAHDEGAQLAVLPELHVLELLPLAGDLNERLAPRYLIQYAEALEQWISRIADSSGMTIVGGSHFKEIDGEIRNVAPIAVPGQPLILAEKNNLTRYEADFWKIANGKGLSLVDPGVGVTVCYDSEFPEAARALAEAGMKVQAVPAWTETRRGFQRVRWSCLARAVENQTFVIHSSLLGGFGNEPVPESFGSSAIIAPSVEPFPMEAILRETPLNEEGVVVADLDYDALEASRTKGEVTNWSDRNTGQWVVSEATKPELPEDPEAA